LRKAFLNQLMNQSYSEFLSSRTAHKMRGVSAVSKVSSKAHGTGIVAKMNTEK
jgi:hypothetical protein